MKTLKLARSVLSAVGLAVLSLNAHAADLTIGYINGIDPIKRAIADGEYEKGIGQKID